MSVARNLTALHALTGCYSTSSFFGKGKKSTFTTINKEDLEPSLAQIGKSFKFDMNTLPAMEKLICKIYGANTDTVSEARYKLFCSAGATEQSLPPSTDALTQHLRRVCYQTKIWRSAALPCIAPPSPVNYGWMLEEGQLKVQWLSGPPAPPEVLKIVKCNCKKSGCQGSKCLCASGKLQCTAL